MTWQVAYLGCFALGLGFVGVSLLLGLHGGADGGHHGGHLDGGPSDLADGVEGVHLPLFSPTVIAVFIGMFGAGGLFATRALGIDSVTVHAGTATGTSLVSGLGIAWLMALLLKHAETRTEASHAELVGQDVEVVLSIRGRELGEVAYVSGGTRHTMSAQSPSGESFAQGERVRVLAIVEGVAEVAPEGATVLPASVSVASGEGRPLAPILPGVDRERE